MARTKTGGDLSLEQRVRWRNWRRWLGVGLVYLLFSATVTWPLLPNFSTAIYGGGADALLEWWDLWAGNPLWTNGKSAAQLVGLPFGVYPNMFYSPHFPLYYAIAGVPHLFPNAITAYNFFTFLGFPGAALASHALAYKITKRHLASFVAGLIYAFAPYHQLRAQAHFSFDPQWIVVFILALWWFDEGPHWKRAAWAGLALGVTVAANPYIGYFAAIAGATLVISRFVMIGWRTFVSRQRLAGYFLTLCIGLGFAGVFYGSTLTGMLDQRLGREAVAPGPETYTHNPTWPFYLSARPWDYLLPATSHPIWGSAIGGVRQQIDKIRLGDWAPEAYRYLKLDPYWFWSTDGGVEHTLFLGYTSLVLAAAGVWRYWRTRQALAYSAEQRRLVVFVIALGCVALWWSAPPWFPIGSIFHKFLPDWAHNWVIPFPIWFSFQVAPFFRAIARIGMLVVLSAGVLAALGFDLLTARLAGKAGRVALLLCVSLVLLIEFASPPTITPLHPAPAVYQRLAQLPGAGSVASYPWNSVSDRVYQPLHQKPLAGSDGTLTFTASPINALQTYALADIANPATAQKLAAMGVQYLIWHKDALGPLPAAPTGLRLLHSFDTADIYQVTATPVEFVVFATPNLDVWISDAQWSWTAGERDLWLWNPTDGVIRADLVLKVEALPNSGELHAIPTLTRPPEEIALDGVLQKNPLYELDYGPGTEFGARPESAEGEVNLRFRSVEFLPGETRLRLVWAGAPQAVQGISITRIPAE